MIPPSRCLGQAEFGAGSQRERWWLWIPPTARAATPVPGREGRLVVDSMTALDLAIVQRPPRRRSGRFHGRREGQREIPAVTLQPTMLEPLTGDSGRHRRIVGAQPLRQLLGHSRLTHNVTLVRETQPLAHRPDTDQRSRVGVTTPLEGGRAILHASGLSRSRPPAEDGTHHPDPLTCTLRPQSSTTTRSAPRHPDWPLTSLQQRVLRDPRASDSASPVLNPPADRESLAET